MTELHLLRLLPIDSPVRRMWAGTKIVAAVLISVALSVRASWIAVGIGAAAVAVAFVAARIPRGALPRFPPWFWFAIGMTALFAFFAGGKPFVHVFGMKIGLGGIDDWTLFTVLLVVITAAGAIVGWTTPLAEIAPAISRLGRPLRAVRVPVDELAVVIALGVRCLPMLVDEVQVLLAARRLRTTPEERERQGMREIIAEPYDLLATALIASVRRATELAEAIEARGGADGPIGRVSASAARLGTADVVMLVLATAAAAAAIIFG